MPQEPTDAPEGIDAAAVTAWLADRIPSLAPPLEFSLITGGHSNLTFTVTDQRGGRWVLRRPPLKQVLATAHDMGREHRVLSALGPTPVPVPSLVGLSEDGSVNGAPFYVMDFVDGTVVRDPAAAAAFDLAQRRTMSESIVDVLADIHAVDIAMVGLDGFGRREDYISRQLHRWQGQLEKSRTRDLPVMDEVHQRLSDLVPDQGPATIVHGDYRLDNCLVGADATVAAVLDWEICTLGDPLADVGLLMVYWAEPGDVIAASGIAATAQEGFPSRADLLARYAERSGRDLSLLDYYVAFGYWKLACIVEGVYARYTGGAMGQRDAGSYEFFGQHVLALADAAREAVGRVE